MGKQQEWKQITYLRKVIKCGKTPITKKPNGTICGGVTLTDETIKPYVEKLATLEANMEANKKRTVPNAKRIKLSEESSTPHDKVDSNITLDGVVSNITLDGVVSLVQQSASSDYSSLTRFWDINPNKTSNTLDEEEEEDDARIADEKWKTHSEKIKKREEQIEKKTYKPPSIPWGVQLTPKTEKEEEEERNEEMKRERNKRSMQIFKLANQVKQMDVLHKYKEFDTEESLLNWLQDVLEQKEEGFDIEDDDTREIAWQREKEDRTRKGLHTDMAEYKAKKLFFESNQFLLEPLQIKLLQKDLAGCLDTGEKYQLEQQVNYLKVKLKQEYHPNLINQRLGKQLQLLRNWDKNKDKFKELGVWEDDLTRELRMKQEAEFEKHTEEKIQKYVKQLKDGTLSLSALLKNSTVTVEEVQDSRPPPSLPICDVMVALKDAEYDKDTDSMLDDTDVDEPPPCPVEMMNQN